MTESANCLTWTRQAHALPLAILRIGNRLRVSGIRAFSSIGLTPLEADILFALGDSQGTSRSQLSDRIDADLAVIRQNIKSLLARGLVDQREHLIHLTPAGRDLWYEIGLLVSERFRQLISGMAPSDISQFDHLLQLVQHNVLAVSDFGAEVAFCTVVARLDRRASTPKAEAV